MTVEALTALEGGAVAVADAPPSGARQIWRRLRAQRAALAGGVVIVLLVLVAVAAPLLAAAEGQDTTTYHSALLNSAAGAVPSGTFGGVSGAHWLGVEPAPAATCSPGWSTAPASRSSSRSGATVLQVAVGVAFGLAAGLGNRFLDGLLSRITDIFVTLPALVFAIALLAVVPGRLPPAGAADARPRAARLGRHRQDRPRPRCSPRSPSTTWPRPGWPAPAGGAPPAANCCPRSSHPC